MKIILYLLIISNLCEQYVIAELEEDASTDLYVIEGKVFPWDNAASIGWQLMTHVMANGGEHYGFLRLYAYFHRCLTCIITRWWLREVTNANAVILFQRGWYIYYYKRPVRVIHGRSGKS